MPHSRFAISLPIAVAALLPSTLSGCAATDASIDMAAPTMAPEQSVAEACASTRELVESVAKDTEAAINTGVDAAWAELGTGKMPTLEFLHLPVSETLDEIKETVTNTEVRAVIIDLQRSLEGFDEMQSPSQLSDVPGFLGAAGTQLSELNSAVAQLRELCGTN